MCAQPLGTLVPNTKPPAELDNATLNHLHLRVSDLDVAQTFYEKHFGWKPVMELPWASRHMRFLKDKKGFLLVLELHPDKSPMPSWFHLGFQLSSSAEVRDSAKYFEDNGIPLIGPLNDRPGYATFTLEDPDGYHLQFYWDAEDPNLAPD
jgi:catechol-2,3-dioxygenase